MIRILQQVLSSFGLDYFSSTGYPSSSVESVARFGVDADRVAHGCFFQGRVGSTIGKIAIDENAVYWLPRSRFRDVVDSRRILCIAFAEIYSVKVLSWRSRLLTTEGFWSRVIELDSEKGRWRVQLWKNKEMMETILERSETSIQGRAHSLQQ